MDATATKRKFWFRNNAQDLADKLNQIEIDKKSKILWTVTLDECNVQYIVRIKK